MNQSINVIVIEGEEFVRKKIEDNLTEEGYNVTTVSNTTEALEKTKDKSFEIIVTEIETPELPKYIEVIRKFKELRSDSNIIVATSYDSIIAAVEALKQGAYDYVIKPFNFDELRLVIQKALEWRDLQLRTHERIETEESKMFFDRLTAVYNTRYFQEATKIEINRVLRYPSHVSFLFIDVDKLEDYKNIYGVEAADNALRDIAQLLWRYTRKTDYVTRYIANQFVVILPETKKEGGFILASRLSAVVRDSSFPDQKNLFEGRFTISIGVVTSPDDARTSEELIQKAELALNQAKKLGRDRIVLF